MSRSLPAPQVSGGHDDRDIAPEGEDHGDDRPPVHPHAVHGPVRKEGSPGHVTGVLEDGEEEEEDEDVGKRDAKTCLEAYDCRYRDLLGERREPEGEEGRDGEVLEEPHDDPFQEGAENKYEEIHPDGPNARIGMPGISRARSALQVDMPALKPPFFTTLPAESRGRGCTRSAP